MLVHEAPKTTRFLTPVSVFLWYLVFWNSAPKGGLWGISVTITLAWDTLYKIMWIFPGWKFVVSKLCSARLWIILVHPSSAQCRAVPYVACVWFYRGRSKVCTCGLFIWVISGIWIFNPESINRVLGKTHAYISNSVMHFGQKQYLYCIPHWK